MKLFKVTAFLEKPNGGNKAGVCIECDDLNESEMLDIAKELNYSETAFVLDSDVADFKIRYFTPFHEIDLCGHATIATFNLLRDFKMVEPLREYTIETMVGVLKVEVNEDSVFMEQATPEFFEKVDIKEIENCFHEKGFVDERYDIIIGSTGLREVFVPVKNKELLHSLKMRKNEILELSVNYKVIGIHLFALDDDVDAYCRNFAPIVGIDEESATGTSNAVLGAYFYQFVDKKSEYKFRQGYSMNKPSLIITRVKEGENLTVSVGGKAEII